MTNFNASAEQFGDLSKTTIDSAIHLARISLDNAERIIALNLEAAKVGLSETAKSTKTLTGVKDIQELNNVHTKNAESGIEFMIGYGKNLQELASHAQSQYSAFLEEQFNCCQQSISESLDKYAKVAPAGSDVAIAAMKSTMAASTAAIDNISKTVKQMTSYADTAIRNATETAAAATSTPKASAKRK